MPSREEIARWLREAAGYAELVALRDGGRRRNNTTLSQHYTSKQEEFEKRAAQVENMRCENCEYFDDTLPTGCVSPWSEFDREGAAIDWCGTGFGCFSWKPKGD